jgi:dihydrolipoamide dehydrogenase
MKQYDIIVVGAGPGGYVAAIKARHLGFKVALIEKGEIGGVCLNWGCIPTKAMLKSAKVYQTLLHSVDYGILSDTSTIQVDFPKVLARKNKIVKRLTGGVKMLLDKNGVDIYQGLAVFLEPTKVQVGETVLQTKHLILALGASPIVPKIPGLQEAYQKGIVKTSKEMLDVEKRPNKVVIIGGGVIGIEFATIYASFGVEVVVIEKLPVILAGIDDEVRDAYMKILKRQKIQIITHAEVREVKDHLVTYMFDNKLETVQGDILLASLGMRPNIQGLESLKIAIEQGAIKVNEYCQTSNPSIYAIGDVNGKSMLAHTASSEAIVAVEHIAGKKTLLDYSKIPAAIYGFPEIVTLGLTEKQAREQGLDIIVSRFPIGANGKSLADGESDGFIKLIADAKYKEIIGAHILAANATEIIPELTLAMNIEATAEDIANSVHMHPTLSEIILEAAHGLIDKPIHI